MRLSSPRVPPIDPEALQGEPRELLDRSQLGGRTLNIFATLIHHPKLMKRWQVLETMCSTSRRCRRATASF